MVIIFYASIITGDLYFHRSKIEEHPKKYNCQ